MDINIISRRIAMLLRHHPEYAGLMLDEHGWANVDELLIAVNRRDIWKQRKFDSDYVLDRAGLEELVVTNDKQRFSFNKDKTLIRANQGHSIPVDVELEEKRPPDVLYHGTGVKYVDSIEQQGILHKARLYVHLSSDYAMAVRVGQRHGNPAVFKIRAKEMWEAGFTFYLSVNGVWLTEYVSAKYFELMR